MSCAPATLVHTDNCAGLVSTLAPYFEIPVSGKPRIPNGEVDIRFEGVYCATGIAVVTICSTTFPCQWWIRPTGVEHMIDGHTTHYRRALQGVTPCHQPLRIDRTGNLDRVYCTPRFRTISRSMAYVKRGT